MIAPRTVQRAVPARDDDEMRPREKERMNVAVRIICFMLLLPAFSLHASADSAHSPKSIPELQAAIGKILQETKTPGAAIAIVSRDKTEWLAGIGNADVAANLPVTPDTLFRLGSVSKGFAAVAVLQLQEAGKLKLTDTLRQWAPEVTFINPWEATAPVRLVHLMEHTSGFDDMHLREFALDDPAATLDGALAYGASSRVCRWPPGERMSYCNSGPAVLAVVVEKASGERFEDYVQTNIFNPLHMDDASYRCTPDVQRRLAKLYRSDGITPYPYWYVGLWPSAGLNASARDMANYVRFCLQRGSFDGARVLQAESIERMERGETLPSANLGPITSYGLYNYAIPYGNFVFHGHGGAMPGCVTEIGYLPDEGCGYVEMINSGSLIARKNISNVLRDYLLAGLTRRRQPPVATVPEQFRQHYTGHYQLISPFLQGFYGLERLVSGRTLTVTSNGLAVSSLVFRKQHMLPVTERLYRDEDTSLATVALLPDKDGHTRIQCSFATFERIPALEYWAQTVGIILVSLLVVSSIVMTPIWIVRRWLGKSRNPGPLSVRFLPLVSAILLVVFDLLLASGFRGFLSGHYIDDISLGTPNLHSISLWLASVGFPLAAVAGLYVAWRERRTPMKRAVYWYSVLVAAVMTAAAIYYAWWGLIGLRLWA